MTAKKSKKAAPKASDKLHYDKAQVLKEYLGTYNVAMMITGGFILFILLYFFVFIVYLGGFSHNKHKPFVEHFGNRIDYGLEYDGLKLPIYGQQAE